jgi:xylulokinase
MTQLLAGVDAGTSGVKVGLFEPDGRLVGLGRSSHQIDIPRPGWTQCDPELWWLGFLRAFRQACEEGQVGPDAIGALGLSVLYPAVMPLDAQGCALYPAVLYSDRRSLDQVREIERRIPPREYRALIGNPLMTGTGAVTSMAWLRDERPAEYEAARALGFANTFFIARLTGEFFTDPTNAALSGLVDIRDPWRWSEGLCEELDIARERLPGIAGSAQVVGARLGGALVYIAGSTDCVAAPMSRPSTDTAWINCAYVDRGAWLAIGATTSSGVSVAWFTSEFLDRGEGEGLASMIELASSSPPGCNGLIYVPYLQGERTPVWDSLARGVFIGLTASTTRHDLARAVFEGTAFSLRQVIERVDSVVQGPVGDIRAVGGGTKNDLWNQIKADVLKKRLHVLKFQETGTLGAALLAGIGCGVYGSFEEATRVPEGLLDARVVAPDPGRAELYDELFALYSKIYPQTRDIMHGLGQRLHRGVTQSPTENARRGTEQ